MRTSIIITFFAMYALISCKKETAINTVNEYKIIISRDDLRKVKVEAELNIPERRLSMDWPAANSVERGWSHFVENLKVYDMEDNLIEIEYVDKATWQLNTTAKRVQISYDVNVMHDTVSWEEGGHSASAYVVEDVVYIIGAALFIASPAEIKRGAGEMANISFSMPYDYDIVVPWKQRGETKHNFSVNSTYELVRSGISFGDIEKGYLSIKGMEVYIATAKDFKAIIPIFKSIYKEVIPAAQAYFDDQLQDKYVVIINKAPRTKEFEPYFSGEALHQSMSFITPIFPTEEFMPIFRYILTHEYVHLWMGINIEILHEDKEYWFFEGFTDYISLGLLNKLGKISQEQMINSYQVGPYAIGWGDNIKKYLVVAGKQSMREAGKSKADNYDLLYSGGSLFALILDIEMNTITHGKIGVHNLISEINKKFGNRRTTPLDYKDIKDMVSELSGTNFDYLFDAYVEGIEIIPVAEYLQKAGLLIEHLGQETQKIMIDPNATENQKLVLKAIINF